MRIILGSSSPRRKDILKGIIKDFDVMPPNADEEVIPGENPCQHAERISEEKAASILRLLEKGKEFLIISCDTIVALNSLILGKPSGLDDARNKLKILSGKTHHVISGVTLIHKNTELIYKTGSEKSLVTFRDLDDNIIDDYLDKIDYADKAGAYAIQEYGDLIIANVEGSISNIVGFPLSLFYRMIDELNLTEMLL